MNLLHLAAAHPLLTFAVLCALFVPLADLWENRE